MECNYASSVIKTNGTENERVRKNTNVKLSPVNRQTSKIDKWMGIVVMIVAAKVVTEFGLCVSIHYITLSLHYTTLHSNTLH